jgi:hypothetical protein
MTWREAWERRFAPPIHDTSHAVMQHSANPKRAVPELQSTAQSCRRERLSTVNTVNPLLALSPTPRATRRQLPSWRPRTIVRDSTRAWSLPRSGPVLRGLLKIIIIIITRAWPSTSFSRSPLPAPLVLPGPTRRTLEHPCAKRKRPARPAPLTSAGETRMPSTMSLACCARLLRRAGLLRHAAARALSTCLPFPAVPRGRGGR